MANDSVGIKIYLDCDTLDEDENRLTIVGFITKVSKVLDIKELVDLNDTSKTIFIVSNKKESAK